MRERQSGTRGQEGGGSVHFLSQHQLPITINPIPVFRFIREKLSVPGRAIIDDLAPNVAAARASGWRTHHYREDAHHLLLAELTSLGAI